MSASMSSKFACPRSFTSMPWWSRADDRLYSHSQGMCAASCFTIAAKALSVATCLTSGLLPFASAALLAVVLCLHTAFVSYDDGALQTSHTGAVKSQIEHNTGGAEG
jgi:hypothetical protein